MPDVPGVDWSQKTDWQGHENQGDDCNTSWV